MKRLIQMLLVGVAMLSAAAGQVQAAVLVGVTGDGATVSESLYFLSLTDASSTFIMTLGNGEDGETIGFNPVDGLLYHASGLVGGDRFWESINVDTTTIVASGQFTGPDVNHENVAMTYNSATGTFLVSSLSNNFFDVTLGGGATKIGTTPENLKGVAFIGSTLYGVSAYSNALYELDPTDGSVVSGLTVTLDGGSIFGMNGLATDPDTGLLWGIFRLSAGGTRLLGTLDPTTGVGTSVGVLSDNFAGIAFLDGTIAAVPEPSTFALLGIGAVGMAFGAVRNRRRTKNTAA